MPTPSYFESAFSRVAAAAPVRMVCLRALRALRGAGHDRQQRRHEENHAAERSSALEAPGGPIKRFRPAFE